MFQKTRFVKLRSWLCVVRHQRLKNDFKLNNQLRNDINKKKFRVAVGIWSSRMLLPLETLWWARVPCNNQWWTRFIILSLQSFYIHIQKWNFGLSWSSPLYGAVLRTIAPHQRGPGSCQPRSQGFGFVIGFLLVPRLFSGFFGFTSLYKKTASPNSKSIRIENPHEN